MFEAEGRHKKARTLPGKQLAASNIKHYDAAQNLPWIERSQIMNW